MTAATPWIKEAESHLGFREGPNNANPFGVHYGIPNQPWCALFVSFCLQASGHPLPVMQAGMADGYAGVWIGMEWAKANGYWRPSWNAERGDAIVYGWRGAASGPSDCHTGFITDPGHGKGTTAKTIEGNRADQVERQSYVVGSSDVLGTIWVTKIVADLEAAKKAHRPHPKPKPSPQPRHPHHPTNTGPGPKPHGDPLPVGRIRGWCFDGTTRDLEAGYWPAKADRDDHFDPFVEVYQKIMKEGGK